MEINKYKMEIKKCKSKDEFLLLTKKFLSSFPVNEKMNLDNIFPFGKENNWRKIFLITIQEIFNNDLLPELELTFNHYTHENFIFKLTKHEKRNKINIASPVIPNSVVIDSEGIYVVAKNKKSNKSPKSNKVSSKPPKK